MGGLGLAWRLAGGFALIGCLALVGTSVYLDRALREATEVSADHEIEGKLDVVTELVGTMAGPDDIRAQRLRFEEVFFGHAELTLALVDTGGTVVVSLNLSKPVLTLQLQQTSAVGGGVLAGRPFRWRSVSVITARDESIRVVVASDMSSSQAIFDEHWRRVLRVMLLGVVALTAAAWAIVRLGMAPLREMADRARGLTATKLSGRLPTANVPAELAVFARAFNGALERIEESFRRLSQFSADLAHDLRTPISNLRGEAEVALAKTRSVGEYQEVLVSSIEEYERLNSMIEAMLFLARADNAGVEMTREQFNAAHEARSVAEFFEPLADSRSIRCKIDGDAEIFADRMLTRRAIANLLSNALRHAEAGSEVTIAVEAMPDGAVELAIENAGQPISAEHQARVFDRFFRGDAARSDSGSRSGLGLAIVKSIMAMHDGDVSVSTTSAARSRFALRWPARTLSATR